MPDSDRRDFDEVGTRTVWSVGRVLANRYRLVDLVGRGGMGVVWRAQDERLDLPVAIKSLPPELRHDPQGLKQLRAEARTAIQLTHPGIVRLHTLEEGPDGAFLVMEYVEGPSLAARLAEVGTLPPDEVIRLAEALCEALAYAHGKQVIHRDLKPGNILLSPEGPKLADLGIACSIRESMSRLSRVDTSGTLPYMAPEQIRGKAPTAQSDLYQLAATLYECVAGHPPFYRGALEWQIVHEEPPPLKDVAPPLATVVMRALAKDPAARPAGALEFKCVLRVLPAPPIQPVSAPTIITPSKPQPAKGPDPSEMILIPAGEFWMGSADDDAEAASDEKPRHKVSLAAFSLDKYPVTNARWRRFMEAGGYTERRYWSEGGWEWKEAYRLANPECWEEKTYNAAEQPVVRVSWYEAKAFCRWAGKRLPTEAEWEYAARGTDGRNYPWGNEWDPSRANSSDGGPFTTTPVGSYPTGASPFGVLDLAGNIWEWTSSLYKPYPYTATDGREDPSGSGPRVYRGGSWFYFPWFLRSASRGGSDPAGRDDGLGFRCAQGS